MATGPSSVPCCTLSPRIVSAQSLSAVEAGGPVPATPASGGWPARSRRGPACLQLLRCYAKVRGGEGKVRGGEGEAVEDADDRPLTLLVGLRAPHRDPQPVAGRGWDNRGPIRASASRS